MTICIRMKNRVIAILALILGVVQLLLILVSWLISAAMPELSMRSLLSSEGIRWFFGTFTDNLETPLLIWLLLASLAWGALRSSGLWTYIRSREGGSYRQHFAFRLVLLEIVILVAVMCALTLLPHAVLLSVTGHLFPSSFSYSIIPVVCFAVCVMSVSYGVMSGSLHALEDILHSLTIGVCYAMPLWLIYILGAELYASFRFVLMV